MLAGVSVAAGASSDAIADLTGGVSAGDTHKAIAESLKNADAALVLVGNIANRHAAFSAVRALSAAIADATGAKLGFLSEGANSAGLSIAGVLPHRGSEGEARSAAGRSAQTMLDDALDAIVLVNVEPDADIKATTDAVSKLSKQAFVIALTPYVSEALEEAADLLLPIGTFAESSGTYVNVAGTWQSFKGVANPVGESRPAWKVLRVLGNLIEAQDFDYVTSEDVREELVDALGNVAPDNAYAGSSRIANPNGADAPGDEIDTPLYSVDGMVRRARALQLTPDARRAADGGDT